MIYFFFKMGSLAKISQLGPTTITFFNNTCTCGLQNIMIDGLVG